MQIKAFFLAALALLVPSALGVTVSYDETKGYKTFGGLPHFPNLGGAAVVGGWNSAQCGTCWELAYKGKSINVLAVDHAASGWNVALGAMNTLTSGQAKKLGRIEATAKQVDKSKCGKLARIEKKLNGKALNRKWTLMWALRGQ